MRLTLNPNELHYLRRAVQRDIESSMRHDMEEYAVAEVALACEVLKVLTSDLDEVRDDD